MVAKKAGLVPEEFDSRLALGEMEFASGETAIARAELLALEKDAERRGWYIIARQAAADLKRPRS